MEEGSPIESIELSFGMGDIQDCCHRYVLDDCSTPTSGWTLFASELLLSGSCLDGVLLDDHSEVDLLWCCLPMGFSWSLFFFSQMTNEKIMSICLGPAGFHIMTGRTLLAIFTVGNRQKEATGSNNFVFVDNLGVFGVSKASGIVTCLGNQLDCVEHRSSPTDVRFWRLKSALVHASSVMRLPGRIWARTLHLSWGPGARLPEHILHLLPVHPYSAREGLVFLKTQGRNAGCIFNLRIAESDVPREQQSDR